MRNIHGLFAVVVLLGVLVNSQLALAQGKGHVSGTIADEENKPASGRKVTLQRGRSKEDAKEVETVSTDLNGGFAFSDLPEDWYRVEIEERRISTAELQKEAGMTAEEQELATTAFVQHAVGLQRFWLADGYKLELGRIVFQKTGLLVRARAIQDGKPLKGMQQRIWEWSPPGHIIVPNRPAYVQEVKTQEQRLKEAQEEVVYVLLRDASKGQRCALLAGDYLQGYPLGLAMFDVERPWSVQNIDIQCPSKRAWLAGKVSNEKAMPIEGARILLYDTRFPDQIWSCYAPRLTDSGGNYRYDSLPTQKYVVAVVAEGYPTETKEISVGADGDTGGTTLDFSLPASGTGTVSGTVNFSVCGIPLKEILAADLDEGIARIKKGRKLGIWVFPAELDEPVRPVVPNVVVTMVSGDIKFSIQGIKPGQYRMAVRLVSEVGGGRVNTTWETQTAEIDGKTVEFPVEIVLSFPEKWAPGSWLGSPVAIVTRQFEVKPGETATVDIVEDMPLDLYAKRERVLLPIAETTLKLVRRILEDRRK